MAFSLLLSRLQNQPRKVNQSSPKRRAQLKLEALEDRTLPAVTVAQLYVADVYNSEFGRNGNDTEIAIGAGELLPGFTGADVANLILSTPGFQAVEVRQLYVRFAGVNPGSDAISFWLDFLTQPGNTIDTVRADFFSSDIYYNRVGGTNTAFVSALFGDVWSQPVNSALLNQFVTALNNGTPRSTIATDFIKDPRGYQAQIVADYDKVLLHDPDTGSLNFFTGFRLSGGTNEQILAQLHGSSELMKHIQFFQSNTVLSDPNIAAQTFRAQLENQIKAVQAAQTTAVTAAAQAQQDAATAAADQMDAAHQVTVAQADFAKPADSQAAATQANNDSQDASAKATDAALQLQIAQAALVSAEPTQVTIKAVQDATAASTAASNSASLAMTNANDAQTAAKAAKSNGSLTDLLNGFKSDADTARMAADQDKATAQQADTDANTDASTANTDQMMAFDALKSVPNYPNNSPAAQLINAAMTSAQAARSAWQGAKNFAGKADNDYATVQSKANDTDRAADMTDSAVTDALMILPILESPNFFDPTFFIKLFQFFSDLNIAETQSMAATKAATDTHTALTNVQTDRTNAHAKLLDAGQALMQTNTDISQAAAAYQASSNTGGSGTGNSGDGSNNGGTDRGSNHGGIHG